MFDKNVALSVVIEVACRLGIIRDSLVWKKILDTYDKGYNVEDKFVDMKTKYLKAFHDLKLRRDYSWKVIIFSLSGIMKPQFG